MKNVKLNNGLSMPILGFGTYFPNINDTEEAVFCALMLGYRHLDTARWYRNEGYVRRAIERSGVEREKLFITGKVESNGYRRVLYDTFITMRNLGVEYLDLLLLHWPNGAKVDLSSYRALEYLYKSGKVKAIGLSNFNSMQCDFILKNCGIKPQVNQIETHVYFQQKKMSKYLNDNDICHESWAPFAEGYMGMLEDAILLSIAEKHNKSVAQVILRYFLQKKIVIIPKSTKPLHIKENVDIFDFKLDSDDMKKIEKLDKKQMYSKFPTSMVEETKY